MDLSLQQLVWVAGIAFLVTLTRALIKARRRS
jgi:hypothetical protein